MTKENTTGATIEPTETAATSGTKPAYVPPVPASAPLPPVGIPLIRVQVSCKRRLVADKVRLPGEVFDCTPRLYALIQNKVTKLSA